MKGEGEDGRRRFALQPRRLTHAIALLAGGTVTLRTDAAADVTAAGGRILVDGAVGGDVTAAGGVVDLFGRVSDDARLAGGALTVGAELAGDLVAAGGSVAVLRDAAVAGRVRRAGFLALALILLSPLRGHNTFFKAGASASTAAPPLLRRPASGWPWGMAESGQKRSLSAPVRSLRPRGRRAAAHSAPGGLSGSGRESEAGGGVSPMT